MDTAEGDSQYGILAFGSLLTDPGEELGDMLVARSEGVETPFPVEFARACSCRDHAPTLAPVTSGGSRVEGAILQIDPLVSEETVKEALWRRETRQQRRDENASPEARDLLIRRARPLEETCELDRVFYAHIKPNLEDRRPARLAELAINSARLEAGQRREDGIAYLIDVKKEGITTPLRGPYEREILRATDAATLREARDKLIR